MLVKLLVIKGMQRPSDVTNKMMNSLHFHRYKNLLPLIVPPMLAVIWTRLAAIQAHNDDEEHHYADQLARHFICCDVE